MFVGERFGEATRSQLSRYVEPYATTAYAILQRAAARRGVPQYKSIQTKSLISAP
jgi:hypothetical protein